jgi:hypothetical protein
MEINSINSKERNQDDQIPGMNTGNASNPSPTDNTFEQVNTNQLLDEKAEKYIREAGNIEDMPDPQEQHDAESTLNRENNNN